MDFGPTYSIPTHPKRPFHWLDESPSSRLPPILCQSRVSIMPWPFCPGCRATLKVNSSGDIRCDVCPYQSNLGHIPTHLLPTTTTYSSSRPTPPIWARSEEEQAALRHSREPVRATITEPCIKCGYPEVGYYTVQLRSVDEGQTVFYECPQCSHTWSVNN